MFASRFLETAAAIVRRTAPLLAVLGTLTLAACDDGGDGDGTGPTGVNGMWETEGLYMDVSASEITFYIDFAECFFPVTYDVLDIDGSTYTVEYEGETAEITVVRAGANLNVDVGGEEFTLTPSDVDPTDLEICDDTTPITGFDPALTTCTSYDPLTVGMTDGGSLFTNDLVDPNGYYYDAYRLQLASAATVEITLTSDQVDPYLYLYSSAGTLIDFDDDGAGNLNSQLTTSLNAGCYIVVASSYDPGETGSYQIVANAF